MEIDRVCFNCNYFIQDEKDFDTGYGACIYDMENIEPFADEIFEQSDFSSCMDEYNKNRIDGNNDACENYEQAEIIEIDPNATKEEIETKIKLFGMQTQSVECFVNLLDSDNLSKKRYAINEIITLIYVGNKMAYKAMLDYFITSEPAKTLEEVHLRVKVIEVLQYKAKEEELVQHYINELLKTPSNNTTRQIYQSIFNYFNRCDVEILKEPLESYLKISKCSPKIKSKVLSIIEKETGFPFPY